MEKDVHYSIIYYREMGNKQNSQQQKKRFSKSQYILNRDNVMWPFKNIFEEYLIIWDVFTISYKH